ncbi:MAG TPA: hypothetical protein VFG59_04410 [Anaeromyxobacter sp.]|nr:hypothetical protein [Anaeromyxobacter sp.]
MDEALVKVRRKLVELMRREPPFKLVQGEGARPVLDRWMATRLSSTDLLLLHRLEELYGEAALAELFAEVLFEAGVVRPFGLN